MDGLVLIAAQILAAYIAADAFSGIYHLATDLGWNIPSQVAFFQNHHERPETMTFDLQPVAGAIPAIVMACFVAPWFFGALAAFVAVIQLPHYYVHHPAKTPWFIRGLQWMRLVVSDASHNTHHSGKFDRDYCILSGWNNWWINPLARLVQRFQRPPRPPLTAEQALRQSQIEHAALPGWVKGENP